MLLASHADVNAQDSKGNTPSQNAASAGHQDVVELLVAGKPEANAKDNLAAAPPIVAASNGHQGVAKLPGPASWPEGLYAGAARADRVYAA